MKNRQKRQTANVLLSREYKIFNDMEKKSKKAKVVVENLSNNEESTAAIDNDAKNKNEQKKRVRKRKRHIYNAIRDQMEFYFGDSNLNKDRFMKKLIEQDPYVSLETFLTFNKIKKLTDSIDMIATALSTSELLELDETNKKVRRKTVVKTDEDVDGRTIYVEALPVNVDHDWICKMFKRFGKVTYVSLPRYAKSRKPKEFGFVEFEKEKSVYKAIKAFKAFNGVLSTEATDPGQLLSIKTHNCNTESDKEKKQVQTKAIKRQLPDQAAMEAKKPKLEVTAFSSDNESSAESTSTSDDDDDNDETKKKSSTAVDNKRRKHKKSAEKRKKQLELSTDATFYELKILPKRDWKKLRNRYLNLQREKTAELKRKAAKERQQQLAKENSSTNSVTEIVQAPVKKSKHEERKLHRMKMNFYGAGDADMPIKQQATSKGSKAITKSKTSIKFEHGLIVKIIFEQPCVNIKEFKLQMRQHKTVKYIDVKEGAMEAFIRFETATAAESYAQKVINLEQKCSLLNGDEEIGYWDKIESDRQMKLNKEVKVPQKRGREKVKASLAKHVFFGEEDAE